MHLSIITISLNGFNAPIKRHRGAEWTSKKDPYTCGLQDNHIRTKDTHRLK